MYICVSQQFYQVGFDIMVKKNFEVILLLIVHVHLKSSPYPANSQ